jgi:hypothetical protein
MGDYFLFANPSFISGMSRVLDLGSTLNEYNNTFFPEVADFCAIKSDWGVVGSDIQSAIDSNEEKENKG